MTSRSFVQKASSSVGFFQEAPQLPSKFDSDAAFQAMLKRRLPKKYYDEIKEDLSRFGKISVTELKEYGDNAENNQPRLEQFDAWGHRIDKLITSEGWRKLHDVSAKEGLVAIGYERKQGEFSRLYQFAKIYLFTGTTAVYGCPLSMTDGAARLIELYGDEKLKETAFKRLTSRDPSKFWTSGQWMTERPGGSDVGNTETIAERGKDGQWDITGFKWFSSATDSDMTMLLARAVDEQGKVTEGSKGLSLFFARVRDDSGKLNGIRVQRLKNKFGTKALPTAELELDGMKGQLVGELGRGVPTIATILNITRIYNAVSCCGGMRTALQFAQDFALKRKTFGKPLHHHPLHIQTLAWMELETRVATELAFEVVGFLGKAECKTATKDDLALLRLMTPLVKLYTAKQSIWVTTEAMEALGGLGYIEETGLPRLYRDAQVGAIWEGTTNILALDVLRVFNGSPEVLTSYEKIISQRLEKGKGIAELAQSITEIQSSLGTLKKFIESSLKHGWIEASARDLSYTMTKIYAAAILVEAAASTSSAVDILSVKKWCQVGLISRSAIFPEYTQSAKEDYDLAFNKSLL